MKNIREKLYLAGFGEDCVKLAKEYNLKVEVNSSCISENLDPDKISGTLDAIKLALDESGCEEAILHGPFTEIIPSAIDPFIRECGMTRLNQAYDLCRKLGIKKMTVHSGFIPVMYYKTWHIQKSVEFWKEFMKDKEDFEICIENVLDEDPYMLKEIVDQLHNKKVKLCLDLGHANSVNSKYKLARWISAMGEDIDHFHIHNNNGDHDSHNSLGDGNIDYEEMLDLMEQHAPNASICIESHNLKESLDWLSERGYI
ncbi:MAG: sugar phosphate isomerase/epimerase [Clostridia bacterium]|nr:sugar phosphate isomerase/epimerase [Clostridia bacterium]